MPFFLREAASQTANAIFQADDAALERLLAPDFEWYGPSLLGKNGGRRREWIEFAQTLRENFTEFMINFDDPIVEDLNAIVRWTIRGRHTGSDLGKPTNRSLMFTGIHIFQFAVTSGGSPILQKLWQQWGQMGLLQNIDLIPFIGGPGTELPGPNVQRVASTGLPGSDDDKQMIAHLFDDVINRDNLSPTHDLIAVDIRDHNPGPSDLPGLAGIQQVCELLRRAFPDLNGVIDAIHAEGDRVAVRWTVRGTNSCTCGGIDATGRTMVGTGIDILRIASREGRRVVVDRWGNSDDTGILLQLGIISLPR